MKKANSFTFYFLFFAAMSCLLPYMVLYYQSLGFTGAQIGLLSGISPLITLVAAPFWTGIADTTHRHKLVMSIALIAAAASAALYPFLSALLPVILLMAFYSFFGSSASSLSDSATLTMLGREKAMYGRVRLGGTIGWAITAPVAGWLVQNYGIKYTFWSYSALMFLAMLVSLSFFYGERVGGPVLQSGMRKLLANRHWVIFLLIAFVSGAGFATVNNFLFPYMETLNASKTTMGYALTISTFAEIPVFFFSNRMIRRLKAYGFLVLGVLITGIRLLLYSVLYSPEAVLISQLINGLTYPIVWAAGVSYANENAPPGLSATAQGLFGAMIFGFGAAAGGFAGGMLLEYVGAHKMYLSMGLFLLACLSVFTLIERRLPAEVSSSEKAASLQDG